MTDDNFKEYAIRKVQNGINKKTEKIIGMSEVYITSCEWCSNESKVVHINVHSITWPHSLSYTIFEDPSFRLQSDWWVCGECKES